MRKKKRQEKILDFLEGRIHLEGEELKEEQESFAALKKILKKEEDFHPPPDFWNSYLPNLRRRMEKRGNLGFVPALAGALSLLIIGFLLFHYQIFSPNLPSISGKYNGKENLYGISSLTELEEFSTSLTQAYGLNDLLRKATDLMVGSLNWEGLGEEEKEGLFRALASQLSEEADIAADLLYGSLQIDELSSELTSKELKELENQLKGT